MRRALLLGLAVLLPTCARDPVTGKRELVLVGEQEEIAMGRQAAREVDAEMGIYSDQELNDYVEALGLKMAAASERPALPWQFRVVDSPVVNAFALPGGFIYLTRGILAYVDNEAALMGVIGHEIGHVTARHSVEQISRQQLAGLGVGLGTIFFPEVRPFGDVLGGSLGLLFLKFGRDAERESDRLGVRYSLEQGYDPREMAAFFAVLGKLGGEERNIPAWASTHPDPEEREGAILAMLQRQEEGTLQVGEDRYKRAIEGLVFGENPREGFMQGRRFLHPELKFQLEFPEGWRVQNTPRAVYAATRDGGAAIQLTASRVATGTAPETHARSFFVSNRLEYGTGERLRAGPFSAYRAPFRGLTSSGEIVGDAGFLVDGNLVYELIGMTRPAQYRRYSLVFRDVLESFDRLRDRSALEIQPLRVRLFEVPETMRFDEALRRAGVDAEHFRDLSLMNQLEAADIVPQGTLLKILERGPA
ncbi:MAG TPA: M48 family metalloprotease [Vicinamibacteria bacterium]|nr:M48 family metalloprotease [Vicinamibacteria bacterium]